MRPYNPDTSGSGPQEASSPFDDHSNDNSFSAGDFTPSRTRSQPGSRIPSHSMTQHESGAPSRAVSDASFKSAHQFPAYPATARVHEGPDSDADSANSIWPTPNLNLSSSGAWPPANANSTPILGPLAQFRSSPPPQHPLPAHPGGHATPSRQTSLRFKLPDSPSPPNSAVASPTNLHFSTHASTAPSSAGLSKSAGQHPKITSPFMDPDTIYEGEIHDFSKPVSPFVGSAADTVVHDADVGGDSDEEAVMKRHRWGTTRHKSGRPQKENLSRSRTLKKLLHPRHASRANTVRGRADDDDGRGPDGDATGADTDTESYAEPKDPKDRKEDKRTVVFNRALPEEFVDPTTGAPITDYPRNKIRTTKYTPISFLPKNISNQFFHNIANIYFLVMIILGAFDIFGVPSPVLAAVPLIVIVIITAIKDAIEDSRRTITDLEVNNQLTHILTQVTDTPEYTYDNYNISHEPVSLWRRFKKFNSRLMIKLIRKSQENLTKEGRANKIRRRNQELAGLDADTGPRKSLDSAYFRSPRPSLNPFGDDSRPRQSMHSARPSFALGRPSMSRPSGHEKTLGFQRGYWKNVRVGDMIRIYNNDEIPADVVILATSDEDNCCYVETKNLDGETNLKVRQALKYSLSHPALKIRRADDLMSHSFEIESEGPHANLYSYQGNMVYPDANNPDETLQESISINNLLLRGCSLRNTKWVVGIVVFTGSETKIMLNAGITPTKQSRISRELNYYVFLNFLLLFIICFVSGLVSGLWYRTHPTSRDYYEFGTVAGSPFKNGLVNFFVALILYQSLVPISLYITIEIIKTAQAFFIYSDRGMYYEKLDYPCTPKSWSISDDLGQIEYIFSDKTGTLTQNLMEFKKCTINGVTYGRAYTEALAGLRKRQGIDVETEGNIERELIAKEKVEMLEMLRNLNSNSEEYDDELTFISSPFVNDLMNTDNSNDKQKQCNEHFMLCLALCHSVLVEEDPKNPKKLLLKAQSPDEAALVGTARSLGFVFKANTKKGVLVEVNGVTKEYQIMNTLEFNSTRKRMSAIIKIPNDDPDLPPKALLICKGADSIIYSRLSNSLNNPKLLDETSKHLEQFATEGLRTLCIAQRELTWDQYVEWNKRHQEAASSLDNREAKMEAVADSIERELILLGGTAIEDRLQDGVPDSIALLGKAGCKLWVLTGDKVETAINIGFSCNLLGNEMDLLLIKTKLTEEDLITLNLSEDINDLSDSKLVNHLITMYLERHFGMRGDFDELERARQDHSPPNEGYGVVIDGDALKLALLDEDVKRKFLLLCKQCKAVLCCRVSPAQKAAVVKLVKDTLDVMTLAIGDGSNDVAMIQAADVGVGIAGEEGRQAVMSSDYAIGQFRFLAKLILVHGRWSYKRFSEMIPSFFFKNVIFSIALFWYGIYNNFDGSYLFEFTYLMFYNLAFTSLPVIFLGVFDQDVSAKVSLLVPQLYVTGILRSEWTDAKFWWYMLDAMYQSVISFFFPYLMYYKGFQSMNGLPIDHRFWMGVVVTCISCIACNLYILFHQYRWDWLSALIVALSILIVYTWTGLWTTPIYSAEFYKAAYQMFGAASFWACTFIGVLVCLMPRFFYDFVQKVYFPKDIDIIRECQQRGDFDVYPEDYDPTDPNRPKISQYTSEYNKRISAAASTPTHNNSPQFYNKMMKSSSSGSGSATDLEQQEGYFNSNGHSSAIPEEPPVNNHHRITSPRQMNASPRANDEESIVNRKINHHGAATPDFSTNVNGNEFKRKSVIDIFKRKNQGVSQASYFDNSSLYENYYHNDTNVSLGNSVQTEEIPMEEFNANQQHASRISGEVRRISNHMHSPPQNWKDV